MPGKNQHTQAGICKECCHPIPAHSLRCPTLLSPKARAELERQRIWRYRNAKLRHP